MNNEQGEELTVEKQYKKLSRALRIALGVHIGMDDYTAIMQLMSNIAPDTCLVLDNTHFTGAKNEVKS